MKGSCNYSGQLMIIHICHTGYFIIGGYCALDVGDEVNVVVY